jgi:glutathione S-transferase
MRQASAQASHPGAERRSASVTLTRKSASLGGRAGPSANEETPMLTVHHLGASQSERIVWLCEELEIPYRLVRYDRHPVGQHAPPDYKALHWVGSAPIITDGDLALGESGAIVEYIIAKHGGGRLAVTADKPNFADYLFWFHYANGTLMPSALVELGFASTPEEVRARSTMAMRMRDRSDAAYAAAEQRLGEVDYFAGDELTAADIMMLFPLTHIRRFLPRDMSAYPNLAAYLQRVGARPAFQRARQKGDPDTPANLT